MEKQASELDAVINPSGTSSLVFNEYQLEERILFRKVYINSKDAGNIDATILNKIKKNVEGICSADGYIKNIKSIINRTHGYIDVNDLAGSIKYDVSYKADVCNIHRNDIIVGAVITLITPAGTFLKKDNFILIFIPSDQITQGAHEINDIMHVIVSAAECNIGKPNLTVVGRPHTYFIPSENERLLIFPPKDPKDPKDLSEAKASEAKMKDINYITSSIKTVINNPIDKLKHRIDEIDPNIWRFYRSLLNPTELVYPPNAYSTFNINPKNTVIPSRAYYKLWEIIQHFKDGFNSPKPQVILNLCENPAGFTKALMDFRNNKADKFTIVSLKDSIKVSAALLKNASKNNYSVNTLDLDVIKPESLNKLVGIYKKSLAHIITADGGIKLPDGEFDEENEMGVLKFSEVVSALSCQEIGGTFVLKMFDSCTQLSIDLIYILYQHYTNVNIYKPETSRPASSERYIIAINFKGINKQFLEKLQKILDAKPVYITKLFDEKHDKAFLNFIKTINLRFQNNQVKKIREMIEMIFFYKLNRPPKKFIDNLIKIQEDIAKKWAVENKI